MKRGSVCWASLAPRFGSEEAGRRPVVVVSRDAFNEVPTWRSVIVVPLTISGRQAVRGPTVAELAPADTGLPRASYALGHQITTLDRSKLDEPSGQLGPEALDKVGRAILAACDLLGLP